jgi:hypothetical protein
MTSPQPPKSEEADVAAASAPPTSAEAASAASAAAASAAATPTSVAHTVAAPAITASSAVVPAAAQLPSADSCKNCGAVLLGRYCVNCSQPADVHVPSTRELVHEALEGLTHSDSRLWRTLLCLWFKPGKLTLEFIAGRRVAYMPPFRLYLVLSIIFFLMASLMHMQTQVVHFDAQNSAANSKVTGCDDFGFDVKNHPAWKGRMQHACAEVVRDNGANLLHVAISAMPKAMFLFLPLVAFLHMLMYWRPRHRYAVDLLFFLHLHAFFFSVAILMALMADLTDVWAAPVPVTDFLDKALSWSMALYTLIAMKRVFQRGWLSTGFKAIVLGIVYMVALAFTIGGVFMYAALQL